MGIVRATFALLFLAGCASAPPNFAPVPFVEPQLEYYTPERSYSIGGEVKAPNRYAWFPGMTLMKAIQSAGDFTEQANRKRIEIQRRDGTVEIIHGILKPEANDPQVFPGDIITVKRRRFVW
jgi:protein involved in polysaccharide export with SLBB domain